MHGIQGEATGAVGPGDTAILPDGSGGKHLNIVLCDPVGLEDKTILVNVISRRERYDSTTILEPGDHPFIVRPSVVFYANAALVMMRVVEDLFSKNHRMESLRPEVLDRVLKGLENSPETPPEVLKLYQESTAT